MRLKKFSPLLILLLALPSCKINDFYNPISSIEIVDYRNAYYQGSSFNGQNELTIVANYVTGRSEYLSLDDVSISLTNGSTSDDYRSAFTSSGTYKVQVSKEGCKSNVISIDVNSELVYASSISVSEIPSLLKTIETVNFTVTVEPNNYNVDLDVSFSQPEGVVLEKTSKNSYEFYIENAGLNVLTVEAKESESTFVEQVFNIDVEASAEKKNIAQTYKTLSKPNSPTVGDVKFLVIPILFSDSNAFILDSQKERVREDLAKAYFGSSSDTGWQSVASFYNQESKDKFRLTGTVSEWYDSGKLISEYGVDDDSASKTQGLINTAVDWYFTNHTGDSRTNYDYDHDGYLDGVIAIYGAPDRYSNGVSASYRATYNNLWAYRGWTSNSTDVSNPKAKSFMWASYDFMYGANTAISHTGRNHYKGNTDYCLLDTHTYIHEVGHILGVEDYYDYSKQVSPVGGFTMQDNNVGGHDPFSVMAYGWASPYVPTESCRIKIYPFQDNNDVILLTPNWNSVNSVFDEYLLLELYTPTGLNAFDTAHRYAPHGEGLYPSGSGDTGIRVWHVDARLCPKNTSGKWVDNFFSDVEHPPISCFDKSTAFTNTYKERGVDTPHMSKVYSVNNNYENFDLLRLIRKASGVELRTKAMFSSADLFYEGDSFDMDTYGSQFAYKSFFGGEQNVLDSGAQLGWSFVIEELTSDYAIIQLTRA